MASKMTAVKDWAFGLLKDSAPVASDLVAKAAPAKLAGVKQAIGAALNRDPARLNVGEVAREKNGAYAQVVMEAMANAGVSDDMLFPVGALQHKYSEQQINEAKMMVRAINAKEDLQASQAATGDHPTIAEALRVSEKKKSVEALCTMLSLTPEALWVLKRELWALTEDDITVYKVSR